MAILTKFLQLLKPERNDYVDVEKHLSENYDKIDTKIEELSNSNDEKLNKGAVSSEYDTAKKIEDKIKEAKKAGDTAKTEADKKLNKGNLISTIQSGEDIFKALQNNTGIKFDENLLYLNDAGTKKKGYCYLDKLTDGIFECIQETTTRVNNATYFKNFSNKELSKNVDNVLKIKSLWKGSLINSTITISELKNYKVIFIVVDMSSTIVVKGFTTKIGEDRGNGNYYYGSVSFNDNSITYSTAGSGNSIAEIVGIM